MPPVTAGAARSELSMREISIPPNNLPGTVRMPAAADGLVIFAHGSGSSRLSPRNTAVAEALGDRGFATLLFDLLSPEEEHQRANVFDVALLADRLTDAITWAGEQDDLKGLPTGLFGASTGAAAALVAAARERDRIAAVVSRGGRPDLAGEALERVVAPTLLIVGGSDTEVIELNRKALERLTTTKELRIVPGAGHLFSEPGTLEVVTAHADDWFLRHLVHSA